MHHYHFYITLAFSIGGALLLLGAMHALFGYRKTIKSNHETSS